MDLSGLSAAKAQLSETTTVDKSKPVLTETWTPEYLRSYQHAVLDVNLEAWLPAVVDSTFATWLAPLTLDDAAALVANYEADHPEEAAAGSGSLPDDAAAAVAAVARVGDGDWQEALRARLEAAIAEGMAALGASFVFVKTSSRSPKDAAAADGAMAAAYTEALQAEPDAETFNGKLNALLRAGLAVLRVDSPPQGATLLLTSERIYQDMLMALKYPDRFHENVVVRQWVDLDVGFEFRGFVARGVLTALSQYNHLSYFAELAAAGPDIADVIRTAFDSPAMAGALSAAGFDDYVIDFGLVANPARDDGYDVWIIEINPFLETTDPALMHWSRDAALLAGELPFEYRYNTSAPAGAKANVSAEWCAIMGV
ncbi:uncharacterized protein AMSG_04832 [Thecamonas trahens ATCC 50062]|uniref:Cell division cycle protein 123 n=1 Tax=Thecamonas trahens ATCC 50062 TaxID=461836 RepID=A0A0L0DAQ7_THETB|nr:hypothetical protein AMSG_04832 [Thecamonas trahens ATCC 50062]KNC48383.1 hypothetical protein AMSG_04832 [Thecamonas trahens ATCC 50062]|eukprot:XP_013758500.1 hypothetical protein AMSG_04832 [Thecamonas trahens ATCC 50062]